jgi:uncharacterized protein
MRDGLERDPDSLARSVRGRRPVAIDALAARVLVKGEPLSAPAGRGDDLRGRAAKSDAKGPRVRLQWHRHRPAAAPR